MELGVLRPNKDLVWKNRKELVRIGLPEHVNIALQKQRCLKHLVNTPDLWQPTVLILLQQQQVVYYRLLNAVHNANPNKCQVKTFREIKRRLGPALRQQWIGCLNLGINTEATNWLDVWNSKGLQSRETPSNNILTLLWSWHVRTHFTYWFSPSWALWTSGACSDCSSLKGIEKVLRCMWSVFRCFEL